MDNYILEHATRYKSLVERFDQDTAKKTLSNASKPQTQRDKDLGENTNPDVVVAARLRPLLENELAAGFPQGVFLRDKVSGKFDAHELKRPIRGPPALPTLQSSNFQVDQSYHPSASTEDIYHDLVQPLVPWAWGGGIGTLFAYGQTGSGKTYTISHLEKLVIQSLMDGKLEGARNIYITIFELAGNTAHDLLNSRKAISVLEDSFGVVQLAGALEHHVISTDEVFSHIESAAAFRRTEKTVKNDASSRSHAICRIRIENPEIPSAEDGLLYLIDLAGSEAARDRAEHGPERMRETREINMSLSVLKDCIRGKADADAALITAGASRKKAHVPFRQSTLTKVLKHVFDPAGTASCKTVVVACVNPCLLDIGASRNTLRYAEMLRVFVPKTEAAAIDPQVPMTWSNAHLRNWIDNNSGTPSISSAVVAPFESGTQLLRLPAPEFESRCLKTEGVTHEHAKAFRSKFWQKHVDSQKLKRPAKSPKPGNTYQSTDELVSFLASMDRSSSRDLDQSSDVPFKERIRPGMVVKWTQPKDSGFHAPHETPFAFILCPVSAMGTVPSSVVHQPDAMRSSKERQFLCAMIQPGVMAETYTVDLWRHIVLDVDWFESEAIMQFDESTRYYYLTV